MATPLSVFALIAKQTADEIFTLALEVAELVGLPVSTWRTGDPTRTQFRALARKMASADEVQAELAKASFITGPANERASGAWLTLRVKDVYNVEREEESFAAPTIVLDNAGGGFFEWDARGLVVASSSTGATFRAQAAGAINPLETGVSVSVVADVGGSAGTVGINEIDTIVTPPLTGVTIASSTAAIGSDAQSDVGLIEQALATLGALSPNGPVDAYEYVARNSDLTGIQGVTRAKSDGDSSDGTVTVYVATTTAALDGPSVAAIQDAIDLWAQPLCTDATVVAGTPQTIPVTYTLTPVFPDKQEAIEAALDEYFAGVDFGGQVTESALKAVAHAVCGPTLIKATVVLPLSDVSLSAGVFPVRGTVVLS